MVAILLLVSVFADFFAPVDPKARNVAFAPPDRISWHVPEARAARGPGWRLLPVAFPIIESDELDPVTFQPIVGPRLRQPPADRPLRAGLGLQASSG